MQIVQKRAGEIVELELVGRLDGYWCDHLSTTLTEVLRNGNHHIRVDCAQVTYLTSAGIGVLMRFHQELARIHGTFQVLNPSPAVSTVIRVTRLDQFLMPPPTATAAAPVREAPSRRLEHQEVALEVFDLDPHGALTCRAIGTAAPLTSGAFEEKHCTNFALRIPTLAVGVGAFGGSFSDCRSRFGELVSVAGSTAYQPGDGTNVADYLVAGGHLGADIHLLYCLACEGHFSQLVRFEAEPGAEVGLSRLLSCCFEAAGGDSLGVVVVGEAAGLVGAALRQSPTETTGPGGLFAHPGVRSRVTFTSERAFPHSVALAAGVVTRDPGVVAKPAEQLRPIGGGFAGHFHAAAFRFRPVRKGRIDLGETVRGLFDAGQLLGVLHLLSDDRVIAGSGESEFVRGACWIGPIAAGLSAA